MKNKLKINWYNLILMLICIIFFAIDVFKDDYKGLIMWGFGAILNMFYIIIDHQQQIYKELNKNNNNEF